MCLKGSPNVNAHELVTAELGGGYKNTAAKPGGRKIYATLWIGHPDGLPGLQLLLQKGGCLLRPTGTSASPWRCLHRFS